MNSLFILSRSQALGQLSFLLEHASQRKRPDPRS
jgi:hypothetical protein